MRNMPMVSLAVISLLASMATATAKAARVTRTPAAMTFADRTVAGNGAQDRITSDGLGTYGNGVDGVACVIFSSTGDANCDLSSSRNPVRVFNVDPSLKISGTGPTSPLSSNGVINIEALAQMHIGDAKLTTAVLGTAIGQFQLVNRLDAGTSSVSVTRYDDHTWIVTTSDPSSIGAGDVAQLIQVGKGGKTSNAGLYHLPFEMTVTCPTCVAPAP